MRVIKPRVIESVPHYFAEIAKQLKIANKLKALELKSRQDLGITPEMVDDVIDA